MHLICTNANYKTAIEKPVQHMLEDIVSESIKLIIANNKSTTRNLGK